MSNVPDPGQVPPAQSQVNRRLSSWKEIAAYFGRNERTVRRWEQTEGLPVHRHLHEKRGTVYAHTAELDAWWRSRGSGLEQQAPVAGRKDRRFVLAAVLVASLMAAVLTWRIAVAIRTTSRPMRAVPLTSYQGTETYPSFSPDGNHVAFSWDGERQDNADIYVKTIGVEGPRRITNDPAEELSPAWSPDGRWIAFLRLLPERRAAVMITATAGNIERKLAEVASPPRSPMLGAPVAWSPNGDWLVVVDKDITEQRFGLVGIKVSNGAKRRLTSPQKQADVAAAVSPDGRSLAFIRRSGFSITELYLLPLAKTGAPEGPERQITSFSRMTASPAWSPDGRELFFLSGQFYSETGLWRTAGSVAGRAQLAEYDVQIAVSRQGRLAFTRFIEDSNIWRIRATESEGSEPKWEKTPLVSSTRLEFNGQISPDGKRIAFESNRSGNVALWLCDRDGSNVLQLTPLGGRRAWNSRWSPDGLRLVYVSGGIKIIHASGGEPQRLVDKDGGSPSWSLDGQWIYFQSGRSGRVEIWKMSVSGGEAVQVTRSGGLMALESIDGRYLYFTKGEAFGPASLWRTTGPGGEEVKILDGVAAWANFTVAEDGIYFLRRAADTGGSVEFFHFSTGRIDSITTIDRPMGVGLSVLRGPNGRASEILYTQVDQKGSDLMMVEKIW